MAFGKTGKTALLATFGLILSLLGACSEEKEKKDTAVPVDKKKSENVSSKDAPLPDTSSDSAAQTPAPDTTATPDDTATTDEAATQEAEAPIAISNAEVAKLFAGLSEKELTDLVGDPTVAKLIASNVATFANNPKLVEFVTANPAVVAALQEQMAKAKDSIATGTK